MAKEAKYLYKGPLSGVTLDDGKGGSKEVMLYPGKEVPLPVDNAYVMALVAQGLLEEVKNEASSDPSPKSKKEVASDVS